MNRLTIEECEAYANAIIGEDFSAPKLLPVRIAQQLADTMRENSRLREALNEIYLIQRLPETAFQECVEVARKALSNKDTDHG